MSVEHRFVCTSLYSLNLREEKNIKKQTDRILSTPLHHLYEAININLVFFVPH